MKKRKRNAAPKVALAAFMTFSCLPNGGLAQVVHANEDNLALHKKATASHSYNETTFAAKNAVDGDLKTRWASEGDQKHTASFMVDLGKATDFNQFKIYFEDTKEVTVKDYVIEGSNDPDKGFVQLYKAPDHLQIENAFEQVTLPDKQNYRYVKITITVDGYPSVSLREFEIYDADGSKVTPQDPGKNVALHKKGYSSSDETKELNADKAFDGDTANSKSRWSSQVGNAPHWLYVDLGEQRDIKTIRLFWETRKATDYQIEISDNKEQWTPVKQMKSRPSSKTETITLDEVKQARYVRIYIHAFDAKDPDSNITWNTISLYEMEVYGGTPAMSMEDIKQSITVDAPSKEANKLVVHLPKAEGYTVTYNGTDLEQVVDDDLTIYHPIVDKTVNVSFKIVNDQTKAYVFKEIPVLIPGQYETSSSDNAAPAILPQLQEWKGKTGQFTLRDSSKIVYASDDLKAIAEEMKADYTALTGKDITVMKGDEANVNPGDFYFALTSDTSLGLMKEGYQMEITDKLTVYAETTTGAYWSTRTILQALKQNSFEHIPQGIARDYPLYEVRGFILDVGRKTFTMDYLKQIVKEMSWYKLNDFQVHLNDNLIFLENKQDPMSAYSAFRLESDLVKKGNVLTGKEGQPLTVGDQVLRYQQDLTSTDVWYTKEEFRKFIKESRPLGVNIVPEIDTPAHALALTKVLPQLRYGTTGRATDHLDLVNSYDQSVAFVQTIFSEYLNGNDPVFDKDTIVHIGADEYNASSQAYRKFVNDMLHYVEGSGRKARVWGSFTQCAKGEDIDAKGVQINLWNFGYAKMNEMYDEGFDLINCNDGNYYIVPNAGYYYDYLSDNTMYNTAINTISGVTIPAGDDQMVGGAFAVWNDMTDYKENGVTEYDVYHRISNMPLFGAKLWGKEDLSLTDAKSRSKQLGDAPRTNFGYEVHSKSDVYMHLPMDALKDTSENAFAVSPGEKAEIVEVDGKKALRLEGGKSYIQTGLETAGLNSDLRVKVKRTTENTDEQILFESPYGSIKAVQKETGKVGFSRESRDYSFDYTLPVNEWVELEFKNEQNKIQLYVNGKWTDTIGDDEKVEGRPLLATMMFPMAKIGSESQSFIGYVDDVRIGKNADFATTMPLDQALWNASSIINDENRSVLEPLMKEARDILAQYDPDAAAIDQLTEKINAAMKESKYQKANYDRVETYKTLIDQLDSFTKETASAVQKALDSIRYDLPKKLQYVVDAYETALVKAMDALQTKALSNLYYVDSATMKATVSSYQADGSDPANVLDGKTNTIWHTDWNQKKMPHWIDLEMEKPAKVNALLYTPRQSGSNGNVTKYRILISENGKDYKEIKTGSLKNDASVKTISFDAVMAKHIRLEYVEAVNNNGSAAEIRVKLANIEVNTKGLHAAVAEAEKLAARLHKDDLTEESWQAYTAKIEEAKELLEQSDPDANKVAQCIYDLDLMKARLRLHDAQPIHKDALKAAIEKADAYSASNYTADSWANLQEKLKIAEALLKEDTVDQKAIDAAADALNEAIHALVEIQAPVKEDKSELYALLNKYDGLHAEDHTKESWMPFKKAYDDACAVYQNESATKEDIMSAYSTLEKAAMNLEKVKEKTETNLSSEDKTTKPVKESVPTGSAQTAALPLAATGLLSLWGIVAVYCKRKEE